MATDDRLEFRYFIDDLKTRVDIVAAISPYVKLARNGRNFKGLCPFHQEDTPSFLVHPDRNYYHCFGCGSHGDVIKFLQQLKHGGDFMATLKELASEHGMSLPSRGSGRVRFKEHRELLERANKFYRKQLQQSKEASAYLAKRELPDEILELFEVGFAPNEWRSLDKLVGGEGDRRILIELGLLKRHESKNTIYDAFRGRIMFPIRNEFGGMVGFGGRTIVGDDAKYLNSPQSRVFDKGRLLYGLHQALPAVKEEGTIILVEGYTDVMSLAARGISFVAAPMGTALGERQVEVVLRYADKIVFCFDGDEAGRRAAERALETVLGALKDGKGASFLFLPMGEDPDSYVCKNGKEAFLKLAEKAASLGDFLIETVGKSYREDADEVEKVTFLSQMTDLIEKVSQEKAPFLRETLYEGLAQKTGVSSERLQSAARKTKAAKVSNERYTGRAAPSIGRDGIFYRLLDCLNSRPDLVHLVSDLPILGEPQEVAFFQEAYQWLLNQEQPKANLLASYIEEIGQVRLARQLKDNASTRPADVDAEKAFHEIAEKLKQIASRQESQRKIQDSLKKAVQSTP